jgi:hypothetical protein
MTGRPWDVLFRDGGLKLKIEDEIEGAELEMAVTNACDYYYCPPNRVF